MTPTTNHELLEWYIDNKGEGYIIDSRVADILKEIQSRLIDSPVYEIGEEYEFLVIGEENTWQKGIFTAYSWYYNNGIVRGETTSEYIRPLTISPEVTSAIALLEKEGYIISKQ